MVCGLTAACDGVAGQRNAPEPPEPPLVLITVAPNATATPTPFQPPMVAQATATSLYYIEVPTLEPFFPTATASPTEVPSSRAHGYG